MCVRVCVMWCMCVHLGMCMYVYICIVCRSGKYLGSEVHVLPVESTLLCPGRTSSVHVTVIISKVAGEMGRHKDVAADTGFVRHGSLPRSFQHLQDQYLHLQGCSLRRAEALF